MTSAGLDWDREKWRGSVASKFIRGGEKNAVKYADEIIVLSKDVQKYFLETYGRETHFIPNGVNRPEVREAKLITDHLGLEKDSYILFLGRLVPEKGIRYLVEAFKNVKTDKKLVIAGGSSDTDSFMEELKELAKGDDRILFTGFVQGAMLDELYSNAYIYTLPSDLEGMPLSLLEAMSYGNCCLVSDIPECAEVVEDQAHLDITQATQSPLFTLIVCSVPRTNKNVEYNQLLKRSVMPLTQPKTDLAYLRSEKAKAEQQLRYYQHREKILEHQIPELTRKARVHRLCTRAGMLESFLIAPEELTNDQVMELLKISFRQPEVALALAKILIGGFVIFMIPQVVGSVVVLLELAAVMLRQVWYI